MIEVRIRINRYSCNNFQSHVKPLMNRTAHRQDMRVRKHTIDTLAHTQRATRTTRSARFHHTTEVAANRPNDQL